MRIVDASRTHENEFRMTRVGTEGPFSSVRDTFVYQWCVEFFGPLVSEERNMDTFVVLKSSVNDYKRVCFESFRFGGQTERCVQVPV